MYMNKAFITLILTSLFLSACGTTPTSEVKPTEIVKKSISQSLKDLIASGTAQKCIWTTTEDNKTISGTMLISGQKFKQTIITGEINTFNITDGTNFYSWSDGSKTGLKMNIAETQKNLPTSAETQSSSIDWNKQYNYDCSPTTVTDADFIPPQDITFTDFSETLKKFQDIDLEKLKQEFGGQ